MLENKKVGIEMNSVTIKCWADGEKCKIKHPAHPFLTRWKAIGCCSCCQDPITPRWGLSAPSWLHTAIRGSLWGAAVPCTRGCRKKGWWVGVCLKCVWDSPVPGLPPLSIIAAFSFFVHLTGLWINLLRDKCFWISKPILPICLGIAASYEVRLKGSRQH